jgi:cytoskeletal protein RodZ
MVATIGIKIANGEFYPIVDENSSVRKRLVLTTVHDKQNSVQIDLYKSYTKTMADGLYIGSLVVENIKDKPVGEPSIEMIVSSDAEGHISAEALDLDTGSAGQHQYLSVSLKSLNEPSRDIEISDFELEQHENQPGLYEQASAIKTPQERHEDHLRLYEQASAIKTEEKKRDKWFLPLIILHGVRIIAIFLILFFIFVYSKTALSKPQPEVPEIQNTWQETQDVPEIQNTWQEIQEVQNAWQETQDVSPAQSVAQEAQPADQSVESTAQIPAQSEVPAEVQNVQPEAPALTQNLDTVPVIQAPLQAEPVLAPSRTRTPPVSSYKVPATIPQNGIAYKLRWGDTLWDIAETFYRNPWLYPRIARYNGIKNPDRIISGTTIRIPPKN